MAYFAAEKENEQSFVAHYFYLNALEEYRKANHKEKMEQTSVSLEQAKKTINLKRVPFEIKDEKIVEALNQYWKMTVDIIKRIVTEKSSKDIYEYLILDDFYLNQIQMKTNLNQHCLIW